MCDTTVGEDDFLKVVGAISLLSDKWLELCHALGIPLPQLSAIRKDHGDSVACLYEGLTCWLLRKYDSEVAGPPTWRKLVAAVGSIDGGAYHDVALRIAKEHKGILLNVAPCEVKTMQSPIDVHVHVLDYYKSVCCPFIKPSKVA